jgi:hypothetical protein
MLIFVSVCLRFCFKDADGIVGFELPLAAGETLLLLFLSVCFVCVCVCVCVGGFVLNDADDDRVGFELSR